MRCPFCGSKMIYSCTQHQNFSAGKAVAGAVAFGVVGAAAGFIGKDKNGYQCSACGRFTNQTMPYSTESAINTAIKNAESGKEIDAYNEYKKLYQNIETVSVTFAPIPTDTSVLPQKKTEARKSTQNAIKNSFSPYEYIDGCPIYIVNIQINKTKSDDTLSLVIDNIGDKTIRSAYFKATVFDDTGDEISKCDCVYQGLTVEAGERFPIETTFSLNTPLAYKATLVCDKISFTDDTAWRNSDSHKKYKLTPQTPIQEETFPLYKYLRKTLSRTSHIKASDPIYQPILEEDYIQCICGHPMKHASTCQFCGLSRETMMQSIDPDRLAAYRNNVITEKAKKRAAVTEKMYRDVRKTIYNNAVQLASSESIEDIAAAISSFKRISDYKDSSEYIIKCNDRLDAIKSDLDKKKKQYDQKLSHLDGKASKIKLSIKELKNQCADIENTMHAKPDVILVSACISLVLSILNFARNEAGFIAYLLLLGGFIGLILGIIYKIYNKKCQTKLDSLHLELRNLTQQLNQINHAPAFDPNNPYTYDPQYSIEDYQRNQRNKRT